MGLTFFDVGANNGSWGIDALDRYPGSKCYAFEPTPELVEIIKKKVGSREDYVLEEVAVSDTPGTAKFNVSGQADWGCSSLLDFKTNETIQETWPDRLDVGTPLLIKR